MQLAWKASRAFAWPRLPADHLGNGWSAEEILRQYPYLGAAEVHAALGYYFDHREEIDAELAEEVAVLDGEERQPPSALRLRLMAVRRAGAG